MNLTHWLATANRKIALALIVSPDRVRRLCLSRGWTPSVVRESETWAIALVGWTERASIYRLAHLAARFDEQESIGHGHHDPILVDFRARRIYREAVGMVRADRDLIDYVTPLMRPVAEASKRLKQAENLRQMFAAREREAWHAIAEISDAEDLPDQSVSRPTLRVASEARDVSAAKGTRPVVRAAGLPADADRRRIQGIRHEQGGRGRAVPGNGQRRIA